MEIMQVKKDKIFNTIQILKKNPDKNFDFLITICAQDICDENLKLNYFLFSSCSNKSCLVTTLINKNSNIIDSISSIYKSANYEEREIFDLFGIIFQNHPNLKRILLPQDFKGHPLLNKFNKEEEENDDQ